MRLATQLLALPTSILLLITSHTFARAPEHDAVSPPWPYNLPPHVMYWPEDPPDRRRGLEVVEEHFRLGRTPVGVMKMSEDEGEKFYMEYWRFEGELGEGQTPLGISEGDTSGLRRRDVEEEEALAANASAILRFRPPFMLHGEGSSSGSAELRFRDSKRALAALSKRDFTCPTGTSDCSSIGYEGSCCTTGEVCFEIEDTGLGPVGCCPAGATCGGTITNCDAPNTACSAELGGGCCIPDYACVVGGCEYLIFPGRLRICTNNIQVLSIPLWWSRLSLPRFSRLHLLRLPRLLQYVLNLVLRVSAEAAARLIEFAP